MGIITTAVTTMAVPKPFRRRSAGMTAKTSGTAMIAHDLLISARPSMTPAAGVEPRCASNTAATQSAAPSMSSGWPAMTQKNVGGASIKRSSGRIVGRFPASAVPRFRRRSDANQPASSAGATTHGTALAT